MPNNEDLKKGNVRISFIGPKELWNWFHAQAVKEGLTASDLIRRAAVQYRKRVEETGQI